MTRSPYLMRRPHGYYVRIRVPADLVDRVGVVELRRALGPMSLNSARSLASQAGSRLKGVFEMLREIDSLTEQEVANLIKDAFADIKAQVDRPYVVRTADPWFERQEQRHHAMEHAADLERQRDSGAFSAEVIRLAEQFTASKGISLPSGSPERLRMIAEGFTRVLIEADRCFVHRLDDSIAPFQPQDTLFSQAYTLPIFYYLHQAGQSRKAAVAELKQHKSAKTQSRKELINLLTGKRTLFAKLGGNRSATFNQIVNTSTFAVADLKQAKTICSALTGMTEADAGAIDQFHSLLAQCLKLWEANEGDRDLLARIRRAASRLDEVEYAPKVPTD